MPPAARYRQDWTARRRGAGHEYGLARLRVHGEVVPEALTQAWRQWRESLPDEQRRSLPPGQLIPGEGRQAR